MNVNLRLGPRTIVLLMMFIPRFMSITSMRKIVRSNSITNLIFYLIRSYISKYEYIYDFRMAERSYVILLTWQMTFIWYLDYPHMKIYRNAEKSHVW